MYIRDHGIALCDEVSSGRFAKSKGYKKKREQNMAEGCNRRKRSDVQVLYGDYVLVDCGVERVFPRRQFCFECSRLVG